MAKSFVLMSPEDESSAPVYSTEIMEESEDDDNWDDMF